MKTTNHTSMEELEAKLLERFGAERPFSVPENYFDGLAGKVMSRIAQQEGQHQSEARRRRRVALRWAVAAVLTGFFAVGGLLLENQEVQQTAEVEDTQYIEDALDYSMIDNMSIASYLTEAE